MSTPVSYFEQMYAADPDPWSFESRWYDARKHTLTVAALTRRRYRSAFEPGCSTGMLTARLAERCDTLLAVDAVPAAARTAAERVAAHPHVTVGTAQLPHEWPEGTFDLVVLSELGYYFDDTDLRTLIERAAGALEPGGELVAVHWRWPVTEHARSGDDVHAALAEAPGLERLARHEEADFILEVFTAGPARSVAQREGLA
ncbi:SAM-dependent methyltransferase [Winogradskya consettensis]|uniref:Methyltransferase n=1 Tax=Winogradskya consettensis TaxID=113560 RepID=A0A919SHY8_9ACTN|nr:class I SAM-dependent methyltransferase [Actinoplanes consettensis]GIM72772.1 methyltransferase [Actinoplanes consettensis]